MKGFNSRKLLQWSVGSCKPAQRTKMETEAWNGSIGEFHDNGSSLTLESIQSIQTYVKKRLHTHTDIYLSIHLSIYLSISIYTYIYIYACTCTTTQRERHLNYLSHICSQVQLPPCCFHPSILRCCPCPRPLAIPALLRHQELTRRTCMQWTPWSILNGSRNRWVAIAH